MGLDIALIIVFAIVGLVIGLISAGLFFIYQLRKIENKARKSWKNKKGFFELKPNEDLVKETTEPTPLVQEKKSLLDKIKGIFKRNKEVN